MSVSRKALESLESTNGAAGVIASNEPYIVEVTVEGTAPLIFHAWDCDSVETKANAAKGSKAKKQDDIDSYVYRNSDGYICMPGTYFRGSIVNAAKFLQDPRSPRKSAMDLFKAGIVLLHDLYSLGSKDWDYLDRRRMVVQRNGITRIRPAFNTGWKVTFTIQVLLPEYISPALLNDTIQKAGKLIGVGDSRPTFGRFMVTHFEVI